MNINIPDKVFKLTALLGIIIAGYCLYSIQSSYELYQNKVIETSNIDQKKLFESIYLDISQRMTIFAIIGIVILILSIFSWFNSENDNVIIVKQNEKIYQCCQSCGKKFSSIREYGTNKDNSTNLAFCIECFKKGNFRNPDLTIDKLLLDVKELGYVETKYPKFFTTLRKRLENLERWKKIEY